MSRIGKKIIKIPEKTEISVSDRTLTIKGPKGTLTKNLSEGVEIKVENGTVTVIPRGNDRDALWGAFGSHVTNMIEGVNTGFVKKLIIEGIGYKSEVKGADLVMGLGFSHQVKVPIPQDLKVTAEKNIITATGINKEAVGQFVAKVRSLKKPEPYKGKGIRYDTEVIRRKQGKKAA